MTKKDIGKRCVEMFKEGVEEYKELRNIDICLQRIYGEECCNKDGNCLKCEYNILPLVMKIKDRCDRYKKNRKLVEYVK